MRYHLLTAALVAGGFLAAGGPADAQHGRRYYQQYTYQQYTPAPRYAPPRYYQPYAPPQPDPYSVFGGGDVEFVRSLYVRYLGREPDPQGMDTWLRRLADFRGDTDRLTREFLPAARIELDANRYSPPADRYAYPTDRPRYR